MSKKEREEAALKRLADQRAAQAAKRDGAINGVDAGDWAREHRREEERKREAERRKQRDERAKEAELAQLKEAYMGGEKVKKKVAKASDRFKFKFDWEHTEDTSRDLNPLYDKKHDAGAPVRPRVTRGGGPARAEEFQLGAPDEPRLPIPRRRG
jgi:ATP-dependent RNA helicase DDX23/PRP28